MNKPNLLPCPFCGLQTAEGRTVVMLEVREPDGFVRGYTITCDYCGTEKDGVYLDEAVNAWNTRNGVEPE